MILEGIVTTRNPDGSLHVTPMGPLFSRHDASQFTLRPYEPSRTLDNLLRVRQGVLHVTDDVLLIAKAALGKLTEPPATLPAQRVTGDVLTDACHWLEFQVEAHVPGHPRHELHCAILHRGQHRVFWGFNRAKHAVLEATILATRVQLLDEATILQSLQMLWSPVQKTAGAAEQEAWNLLIQFFAERLSSAALPPGFPADEASSSSPTPIQRD